MLKKSDQRRHILAVSGGKDSAALAVYLKDKVSELEYVFLDTGHELHETYIFLDKMEAVLGIKIVRLKPKKDFEFWLNIFRGCLPSPENRWCTKLLKIVPYEHYIGNDKAISYIAIRADENRTGYISHSPNIAPEYPFINDGIVKKDVFEILDDIGLGLPEYYSWRSRSGCYFCFFQRRVEWVRLSQRYRGLFEKACEFETNHSDGRTYTWIQDISLRDLVANSEKILAEAQIQERKRANKVKQRTLSQQLSGPQFALGVGSILGDQLVSGDFEDDEDAYDQPCLICTL